MLKHVAAAKIVRELKRGDSCRSSTGSRPMFALQAKQGLAQDFSSGTIIVVVTALAGPFRHGKAKKPMNSKGISRIKSGVQATRLHCRPLCVPAIKSGVSVAICVWPGYKVELYAKASFRTRSLSASSEDTECAQIHSRREEGRILLLSELPMKLPSLRR